ncbi:WXG100 family type VII secretion target [Paenibacillus polysaccharolyticus]|uniref:WXG100 family type VII secretion target n=1 Tax=Paenibacillus polysaccharolyticus TaxID=582692 RepID=UPI0030086E7B
MTTIKVTPEQLLSVSKQFATAQSQIAQMNHVLKQQLFEIERQWNGSTKERFYADFIAAQRVMDNFCSLSLSIAKTLEGHAEKFRLADQQTTQSYDANCMPPPPDECRAPTVDNRNAFQKSVDSLKELGTGFMQAADDRYQKRYDSVGGFLDYWTFGIPSGLVEGYMDRADKAFNSANDTANWLTFGIHGTIREAIFPTNAWSSEHWANMMGMGGMMVGGGLTAKMIKPHNLLTSSGGGAKVSAFNRLPEAGRMTENSKITRTGAEWDEYLRSKYGDDNVTWVNKNNFEYLDGFDDHLINAQSIVRKKNKGIVGGHNLESFERILTDQGWNLEELIVSKTPHPTISGVLEIDYRIPALDRELKVIADQYKNIPSPKTVYDPKVISNEQMIQWGKEAMASGEIVVREIRGTASNGLKFTGYLNESGKVTNFFPTISE